MSRLDQEFKTGNITGLIEDKAKEYTEKKSKKYIANKFKGSMISFRKRMNDSILSVANEVKDFNNSIINEKITPKIEESGNKLKAIDKQLNEALKRNEEFSNFMLTWFKAQSDDSEAYEQLARWGYNEEYKSYPFREIAVNTYDSIRRTYIERVMPTLRTIMWHEGVDPKTFTYDDFKYYFKNVPLSFHADLVRLIWENKDLSKKEKMELLVDVISTNLSNSLNAKYFAGNYLADEMKISWQPFNYTPIQKEWGETKDKIPAK